MTTIDTDENNDIYLTSSGFTLTEGAEGVAGVCEAIVKTQRGELQFDTSRGIPWFETVYSSPRNITAWLAATRSAIKDLSYVTSVKSLEYVIEDGTFEYAAKIATIYGDTETDG